MTFDTALPEQPGAPTGARAPAREVAVAGGGTGKTHPLVGKYPAGLLGDDDGARRTPDRVLAITFTDKAASEMRARVSSRLAGLLYGPPADRRDVPTSTLEALRRALPMAPICTFHALCARVLRDHALA